VGGAGEDRGHRYETPKTPRYILTYQINPDNMVYGSMAEGFRIGGVNRAVDPAICGAALAADGFIDPVTGLPVAPRTYHSDRVRSYEMGMKIRPVSSFRVAASVYYIDWFDIIPPVDLSGGVSPACTSVITANLGKAVSKGADLEMTFAPTRQILLNLMINYDDAKYTQTIPGQSGFNLVTDGWTLGQTPWTIVGSGEYRFTGFFGVQSYFRTDVDFRSKNSGVTPLTAGPVTVGGPPLSASFNPYVRPDASSIDVRLRYSVQISSWDVSLFVNNALNNHPLVGVQNDSPGGAIAYGPAIRPLTAGITVQSRF
jgi:outer membrane receptor protein involved in Fe transport